MPYLSFLMPVKNEEAYIKDAILSIAKQEFKDWELVIVNDHSEDETVKEITKIKELEERIILVHSKKNNQINAFNRGYKELRGDYIKLIGGDDLVPQYFSKYIKLLTSSEATYHNALIIDCNNELLTNFKLTSEFQEFTFLDSLKNIMISPPAWSWTFSKKVADNLFPLPVNLPTLHEDIYIALSIKKYAKMRHINLPLYCYRRHNDQLFGGIYNYRRNIVKKRAQAMIKIISILKEDKITKNIQSLDKYLKPAEIYYNYLLRDDYSIRGLLNSKLDLGEIFKALIIKKSPTLASKLSKLKSRLNSYF